MNPNPYTMEILPAKPTDIKAIMDIIETARQIMRENGNMTQWVGYPSGELIAEDIRLNQAFVCWQDGQIVGYFCLITGSDPDPNYRVIEDGQWLDEKPYGVIHRLASGRQVKGVAQAAFDYAFSVVDNVRVDTHHDNLPMQNFLKKNGFTYCGIIYVNDGTPRDAFQKRQKKT